MQSDSDPDLSPAVTTSGGQTVIQSLFSSAPRFCSLKQFYGSQNCLILVVETPKKTWSSYQLQHLKCVIVIKSKF